ncbi:glycosyltransferase family 2 protein [Spirosoma utsteinense]|uniref:Glycosyltransferase involved in cell wall biosynthesis n=1 Tax=Spirosoma utsteinense TaxID=2585773 RepID=A0ABR6WDE6_9BACT|nr:glycosyltransferase family 2 protein [Spirosoma utsteinense]MBC3788227.1 glycosyltransferase involved in cell wall biosynthesis [Spirosoma utsteinense]MBC3794188.1 glycosyltransferase involved in cell wall biosynthesis [Spirosoma utsteinense]
MSAPTVSVLVTTYNRPDALERCLISVFQQSHLPTEILVCDDGSGDVTRQTIARLQARSPVPLQHIWQPDDGFRLARIRNQGLLAATGAYLIQVDGDVILHRQYIADHLRHARPGYFFSGNQYHIPLNIANKLLADPTIPVQSALVQSAWNWRRLWSVPLQWLMVRFYHWDTHYEYVLGCNMGFWRQDLMRVNGYDEEFRGWGWEDTELVLRLINLGCTFRFIRFGAIQYHLDHPHSCRTSEGENRARAMETIRQRKIVCAQGVSQHIPSPDSTDEPPLRECH